MTRIDQRLEQLENLLATNSPREVIVRTVYHDLITGEQTPGEVYRLIPGVGIERGHREPDDRH